MVGAARKPLSPPALLDGSRSQLKIAKAVHEGAFTMIFAAWKALSALPRWLKQAAAIIAAALALWLAWTLYIGHVRDEAVEEDRAKAAAQIAEREAQANASAAAVAAARSVSIAQGNERARAAASGSADPLKSGMDALGK